MKVAVLAPVAWRTPPHHYGPWEQMASNVAEGLVALGVDVTLFATADSHTAGTLAAVVAQGYEEDRTQDAKVVECLHISHLMERAAEFDLIHNHFDFLPLTYSRLIPTPMVTTIHGFSSEKILAVYEKYATSTAYVSISHADRSPRLPYAATVYNGLRVNDFVYTEKPDDYLLFFGRIHPDKGTAEAIDIARRSGKRLLIAGIVQDAAYFREQVEPLLSDDIVFLGPAGPAQRNQLLGQALALLHPIRFAEPFGLSVAEAQLCGTPVIAFNKGAMPELIQEAQTGFLVDNVGQAVEAVQQIGSISRAACRAWASANFSQEKMAADYLAVYKELI
ncbi:glycosyltransferase family 4 protein [Hymenobacter arizonensis]|uniref:Glycosyltransferase involved in cell wall bisynthesis n=1 Tax=Hymenobacter arizonensis TaxID=1227077 RepID=A0A1I5UJP6_HYMAR|nr:glycosyltransferase family 4 protein [Hymenobacter arizonensis]SFP94846.1 Glycosyltransferase involved in cell wall bisynthesis [Hymenobacter arizonensis]